jgi:hypothetical protein
LEEALLPDGMSAADIASSHPGGLEVTIMHHLCSIREFGP